MKPTMNRRAVLAISVLFAAPFTARAQNNRAITLIVPYAAGAAVDRAGRAFGQQLERRLGQPVIVENVAGGSGTLGARRALRAPADGTTIIMGTINDLVIAPAVMKSDYSLQDFTPLARTGLDMTVLVAHPGFPANTADEFVKIARSASAPVQIGVPGSATMQTFGAALLAQAGGFEFQPVTYKSGSPLITDLMGNQVGVGTIALSSVLPMVRQGKLKALGVLSSRRHSGALEIPTVNEGQLLKGVQADLWLGLLAPGKLPSDVQTRLATAIRDTMADPSYKESELRAGTMVPEYEPPTAFGTFMANEQSRLKSMIVKVKVE